MHGMSTEATLNNLERAKRMRAERLVCAITVRAVGKEVHCAYGKGLIGSDEASSGRRLIWDWTREEGLPGVHRTVLLFCLDWLEGITSILGVIVTLKRDRS